MALAGGRLIIGGMRAYLTTTGRLFLASSDALLAIADPTETGKAGGTLETMGKSFATQSLVTFLSLYYLKTYFLTGEDALRELSAGKCSALDENVEEFEWVMKKIFRS